MKRLALALGLILCRSPPTRRIVKICQPPAPRATTTTGAGRSSGGLPDPLERATARKRRIHLVKLKIRRHVEHGQAKIAGAAVFNYDGLVQGGVVERGELPYAQNALDELVADGILERVFGRSYALKGRGPSGRPYP